MSKFRSMVTKPPKTSMIIWAEVASVVRCGSSVGGSTYSLTRVFPLFKLPASLSLVAAVGSSSGPWVAWAASVGRFLIGRLPASRRRRR